MSESLHTAAILRSLPGLGRRPRNGKIARLPQATREFTNQMLEDGLSYTGILQKLRDSAVPPLPYPISKMNLSNWYHGGFQDWRRQRELDEFLNHAAHLPFDQSDLNNLATPNPPPANLPPATAARPERFKNGSHFTTRQ